MFGLLHDVKLSEGDCLCHGHMRQIDALLPDNTPVRVMQSHEGFHVSVGDHAIVPDAIAGDRVIDRVIWLWRGGVR